MIDSAVQAPDFVDKFPRVASFVSKITIPVYCPPVAAIIVGFVLYIILAKAGLLTRSLEMPRATAAKA